jgi:hypothetical protein
VEEEELSFDSSVNRNPVNCASACFDEDEEPVKCNSEKVLSQRQKPTRSSKNVKRSAKQQKPKCVKDKPSSSGSIAQVQMKNSSDILTGPQLIEFFESFSVHRSAENDVTTIGMVN